SPPVSVQFNVLTEWVLKLEACRSLPTIDDKEFDIPQVDTPPTLENLLNTDPVDSHSCETSSLASSDSGDPAHLKRKKTVEMNASVHGSVLRHSLLKGISAQIVSAAVSHARTHTVSGVIAVGTSHGLALVFDVNQALRLCLGTTATGAEFGAVSALSINHDCSRLLCGFAKGQITMWDLANGKLLRTITDAHPPGTAILHVKFTDDPTLAICNDSGGSVFELAFRRVMGMRSCDSRCLFSGSKGEVCCIEPLHTPPDLRDHPITPYSLLAMGSLTKILVIGLKPSLKVWMTFPYNKSDPSSVPQLAWQFVPAQKTYNPVLAFCRGDTVHFLLVKKEEAGSIHVVKQRQLHLNCDLISLSWISSRTLVLVNSQEQLQVVDRPSQEVLDQLDLEQVQLVYNSRHFKSLATGGNVSEALALVGEKACYESVCSYAGQILYLGTKSAHIMTLRNWRERVDFLLRQERFGEALALAWSFHEGTAKAVVGLYGDPGKRRGVVADKMVEILILFVERSLKRCPDQGKIQVLEQHFQEVVPVVVDYCLLLQRSDLLFEQLYSRLVENVVSRGMFLEALESYIISQRLAHLTTPIMKDLLAHYHGNGLMDRLERLIVHLDVTSLDMQQVVQMCWENHLYDAMIYVFNRGMNDYITPLEQLLYQYHHHYLIYYVLADKPKCVSSTDEQVVIGNKLLVYISCSLAGRAYPLGDIPEDLVPQVKNKVFDFLIRLHSETSEEEEVFPFIRTLLHFDTREFLNVLALTFEDFRNDKQALEYQQRIVDILLKVMVDNPDFTPSQVGGLFTFLARQMAKPDNTLFVNRKLFDQVLEFLCCPDDDSRHTERQQVLLELLHVGGVVQFDEGSLLALAEKAEFYQICEFLYEKQHLYEKIIDCYLRDNLRKVEVFSYIHNLLSIGLLLRRPLTYRLPVSLTSCLSVSLSVTLLSVCLCFHLSSPPECLSLCLSLLLSVCVSLILPSLLLLSVCLSCLSVHLTVTLDPDLHEQQVGLLCRFDPPGLQAFLETSQLYPLEAAIKMTEQYGHSEATSYLLEKKGDAHGAFTVLLTKLKRILESITRDGGVAEGDGGGAKDGSVPLEGLESSLDDIIALCQRNSQNLNQQQREVLWFPLLEAMMAPQKLLRGPNTNHTSEALKELTMKVLNAMSSFIPLPDIIQRILQDPVYGKGKLSEIQGLILGMLDTFNYEQTLLETTTSLLNHDLHWSLAHLRASVTRGLVPRQDTCNICLLQYRRRHDPPEEIVIFSCGHLYHCQCLQAKDCGSGSGSERPQQWSCFKCSSNQGGRGGAMADQRRARSTSLAQVGGDPLVFERLPVSATRRCHCPD
uniref:VPS8 subunit of CORVET complex n=1 Tax=Gadus morhua TaxID=8049 RepID=A0A8C5CMA9_GADMO